MNRAATVRELLHHPHIHRAHRSSAVGYERVPTGFPALDKALGGWPMGALAEILHEFEGIGELRIAMPALARLSQGRRWILWVAPPYVPYSPALCRHGVALSRLLLINAASSTECWWAAEQALRSGACSMVMLWSSTVDERRLRRLQLAAETGGAWALLFREARAAIHPSPAAVRLRVAPCVQGLAVQVLKCRGRFVGTTELAIALPDVIESESGVVSRSTSVG